MPLTAAAQLSISGLAEDGPAGEPESVTPDGPTVTIQQCVQIDFGIGAVQFTCCDQEMGINLNFNVVGANNTIADMLQNGFDGVPVPSIQPCGTSYIEDYGRVSGSFDLYVFAIGPSAGGCAHFVRRANTAISWQDTIIISSPIATTIALPVGIEGNIVASESFGDAGATYARGTLSLSGSVGGASVGPESVTVESVSIIPSQGSISEALSIPVAVQPGVNVLDVDVTGQVDAEVSAKSTGFLCGLSGAATVGVILPGSIWIGSFTGENGAPLPNGISIRSDTTGLPYAPLVGDLDGDWIVSITDFLLLMAAWGPCADCGNCPADLNADCTVGINDFLILIGNWS
jgi:hypothetical protein